MLYTHFAQSHNDDNLVNITGFTHFITNYLNYTIA